MTKPSTFELDTKLTDTLDSLRCPSAPSRSDVIRRAVTLLKMVKEAEVNGERVFLCTDDDCGNRIKECEILLA